MSIIKIKILRNNQDNNIKFGLSNNVQVTGYQQEINEITDQTKKKLINPIIDDEITKFKFDGASRYIQFYFDNDGTVYDYTDAGFTEDELNNNSKSFMNSFFILDMYDTYDVNTQTRIFRNYLTKLYDDALTNATPRPRYEFNKYKKFQLSELYLPKSYINTISGTTSTTYFKFMFFNGKTGDIYQFYNDGINSEYSLEKMYFECELDLSDNTWSIPSATPYLNANRLLSTNAYSNKINDAVDDFKNLKQEYPTGDSFDIESGDYFTT